MGRGGEGGAAAGPPAATDVRPATGTRPAGAHGWSGDPGGQRGAVAGPPPRSPAAPPAARCPRPGPAVPAAGW